MVHSYRSIILINDVSHWLNRCVSSENGVWDFIGFAGVLYNIFAKKSRIIFKERRGHGVESMGRGVESVERRAWSVGRAGW